ncbi:MAG: hypothetical protein ABIH92_00830 [Nanoarchaeota archaeon]
MGSRNPMGKVGTLTALGLAVFLGSAPAGNGAEVEVRANPVWIADDTAVNTAYVWADNSDVSGNTRGVDVILSGAPSYVFHQSDIPGVDYGRPSGDDFFLGSPTIFSLHGEQPINQPSDYFVQTGVPPGSTGNLYFYGLSIDSLNAPFGPMQLFDSGQIVLQNDGGGVQAVVGIEDIVQDEIMVVPTLESFAGQMQGPGIYAVDQRYNLDENVIDPDHPELGGDCSLADVARLQQMYSHRNPSE